MARRRGPGKRKVEADNTVNLSSSREEQEDAIDLSSATRTESGKSAVREVEESPGATNGRENGDDSMSVDSASAASGEDPTGGSDSLRHREKEVDCDENEDDDDEEEEEILVVMELADFKNHPILDDYKSITIESIDTPNPMLQIGEYSLHGQLEETVGTHYFYDTKNRTETNDYRFIGQTTKKIKFTIAPPEEF